MIANSFFVEHSAWAQRLAGDWQGTPGPGGKFHVVLKVQSPTDGTLRADLYSVDQSSAAITVQSLTVNGSAISFQAPAIHGSDKGTLNSDGTNITGTWAQRNGTCALNFDSVCNWLAAPSTKQGCYGLLMPNRSCPSGILKGTPFEVLIICRGIVEVFSKV